MQEGMAEPREPRRRLGPKPGRTGLVYGDGCGDGKEGKLRSEAVETEGEELREILGVRGEGNVVNL